MFESNEAQGENGDQPSVQALKETDTSSSDDSSSSSTSDDSGQKKKSRKRKFKKHRRSDKVIKRLSKQVSDLRSYIFRPYPQPYPTAMREENGRITDSRSDNNGFDNGHDAIEPLSDRPNPPGDEEPEFNITLGTSLKAPAVPKTPAVYLESLKNLQRFEDQSWSDVRYSEVEKSYAHSPGFVELEVNDEVKAYEPPKNTSYVEKSFAALTYALLKQRECLEKGLRDFLKWNVETELTSSTEIKEKLESIFLKGEFFQITSDALQMVCGHRADMVQQRREAILRNVKDPLVKTSLKKIPPSCTSLFEAQAFTTALEKAGGVRKTFWNQNKTASSAIPAQAGPSGTNQRPAQGSSHSHALPAQGINARYNMPAQGNPYQFYPPMYAGQRYRPAQGPNSYGNQRGASQDYSPFRGRGGHQNRRSDNRGATKRSASPSYKDKGRHSKRRKF